MDAGDLDREIVLHTATTSTDATSGQEIQDWEETATIWAQWIPGTSTEAWRARQIHSEIEGVYKVYWRDDITPEGSRILGHDGRTYDVKAPIEDGRGDMLLIPVVARGETP